MAKLSGRQMASEVGHPQNQIVVLLGFDGSGRSSVLDRLGREGYAVSTWKYLKDIPELAFMRESSTTPGRYREGLPPLSRAVYLLLALFAEYEFIIKPALDRNKLVIVDSYYLRPVAKEIVKGKCRREVLNLALILPPPSAVIVFDISPEEAFRRKTALSQNEVLLEKTVSDYCAFQQAVLKVALEMVDAAIVHHIDASQPPEDTYRQVKNYLRDLT